jgi:acylphosphatase
MTVARHIIAKGRVQGVGYRNFVVDAATAHNLQGWVRNRMAGTVEAVLSGPAEAVDAVIEVCKTGPRGARVDGIDQSDATPEQRALYSGTGFSVLPTV